MQLNWRYQQEPYEKSYYWCYACPRYEKGYEIDSGNETQCKAHKFNHYERVIS